MKPFATIDWLAAAWLSSVHVPEWRNETAPLCATLQLDGVREVTEVATDPEKAIAGVNVPPAAAEIGIFEMLGLAGAAAPPDRGASTTKPNAATVAPGNRLVIDVRVRFIVAFRFSRNNSASDASFAFFEGIVYSHMPSLMAFKALVGGGSVGGRLGKVDMENKQPPRKPRISAAEARQKLIDTVIEIVETAPLQQLTVRNIAKHAGTDSKTIFRNFESLEDLFIAVVRELEQRIRISLEAGEGDLRPVAPAIPYLRLATWLYLSGTKIEKLQGSPEATAMLRTLTLGTLDSRSDLSERAKATLLLILTAFITGQATVGQFQPQIFTPGATLDAVNLITAFIEDLPRLTDLLGWNHESEET